MLKVKVFSNFLSSVFMVTVYCLVASYFVSMRANIVEAAITVATFLIGAVFYFRLNVRQAKKKEELKNMISFLIDDEDEVEDK